MPSRSSGASVIERSAQRIDQATGVTEEAEFFGPFAEKMFGVRYTPPGSLRGGVVICSSLHAELLVTYRSEVLLARALSANGFAVQRFQYRGAGHSEGESSTSTVDSMIDDTGAAVDRFRRTAGVDAPAFIGTRWGALMAASGVRQTSSPLALWEPVLDARRFFHEALRAARIRNLKEQMEDVAIGDLDERLDRDGFVDVLGYPLDQMLYRSAEGRMLDDELGKDPRQILIAQVGRGKRLRTPYQAAADRWTAAGSTVDVELVEKDEISWFLPDARRRQDDTRELVNRTVAWFERTINGGVQR
jgi:alpha/beta superfamily hydrolase